MSVTDEPVEYTVMRDQSRPCLFHVAGPCSHPKCLEAHYETIKQERAERAAILRRMGGETT
jgi:hypothetical protein